MDTGVVWIEIERFFQSISLSQTNTREHAHLLYVQLNFTQNMEDLIGGYTIIYQVHAL